MIFGSYGNYIFSFFKLEVILILKDVLVAFVILPGGGTLLGHLPWTESSLPEAQTGMFKS